MASTASIPSRSSPTELIVGHRYRLGKKIGAGSFGDIYIGVSLVTGEEVAVKLEKKGARHPQLEHEMQVYMHIKGGPGIPFIRWYGPVGDSFALVMDLLGPSIQELFEYCSHRFTLKTVLMLADQMIARVDHLHRKNFIHRDLKPENFLMGMGSQGNQVFLVDYGLAKIFRDMTTFLHIPERQDKQLCGTARYASRNAHFRETSRRDDMESLGFIFLYFLRGSLPWQGLKAVNQKQKYEKISSVKMSTSVEELCKNHPLEFVMYLNYCRRLRFEEIPDYDYIRKLFRNLMLSHSHQYDQIYDWTLLKRKLVAKSK